MYSYLTQTANIAEITTAFNYLLKNSNLDHERMEDSTNNKKSTQRK